MSITLCQTTEDTRCTVCGHLIEAKDLLFFDDDLNEDICIECMNGDDPDL